MQLQPQQTIWNNKTHNKKDGICRLFLFILFTARNHREEKLPDLQTLRRNLLQYPDVPVLRTFSSAVPAAFSFLRHTVSGCDIRCHGGDRYADRAKIRRHIPGGCRQDPGGGDVEVGHGPAQPQGDGHHDQPAHCGCHCHRQVTVAVGHWRGERCDICGETYIFSCV